MKEMNSETIYTALKHEILDLTLKPGQSVSEHELCERFAVSRTPVRTALQRLQADGLVHVIPYRGSTVCLLDFDEIRQMIYLRTAVESEVIRDFIPLCTPLLEEKIRYQIRKQMALIQGEFELAQFYEMDSNLHAIWFRETGKEKIWRLIQRAQIHYTRFRVLDIAENRNFTAIIGEHEELLRVICEKREDDVAPLMRRHLYGSIGRLREKVQTEFREYFIAEKEK